MAAEREGKAWDIRGCARCGRRHRSLKFYPFSTSPIADSDGTEWTHWGVCPETGEPVLQRVEKDPPKRGRG